MFRIRIKIVINLAKYSVINHNTVGLKTNFDSFLFNTLDYALLQECKEFYILSLIETDSQICEARITIFIDGQKALSPYRAPFGSIEFNPQLVEGDLQILVNAVNNFIIEKGLAEFFIKSYPQGYFEESKKLLRLYIDNGFKIIGDEINFHLGVTQHPFEDNLHHSEIRRLKKSETAGFQFSSMENPDLSEVFDFIKNYIEKGNLDLVTGYFSVNALALLNEDTRYVFLYHGDRLDIPLERQIIKDVQKNIESS